MVDKSGGVDFDRRAFVQPRVPPTYTGSRIGGLVLGLTLIGVLTVIGYRLLPAPASASGNPTDVSLAEVNQRLSLIEDRLTRLEETRGAASTGHRPGPGQRAEASAPDTRLQTPPPSRHPARTVYLISPTTGSASRAPSSRVPASTDDPGANQRLTKLQQGVGQLQQNQQANSEAWQATTDRLADMAGQVGSQNVQILRNQDELNEVVNRTEMEAIPFELLRGSNPTPVGPVALVLKSTNPKKQSYTVCVYVQPSCVELKDRMIHEVVQFVAARNSTPLEIVATRIVKDEILGYLEVPRNQLAH
ncbi:MAG: hypothetical protein ACRD8A_10170 [Candidatus Acidiferrales bacterium]